MKAAYRPAMSLWRQLTRGVRILARRTAADEDLDDEVRHYLEEATAAFVARGLSPEAARRAARLEVGSVTSVREQVRASGWEYTIGTTAADLRYAARRLRSNPGFAAIGILTLALGIGASTAIFSAVNPILFVPLPYPQPGRIVTLWDFGIGGLPIEVTFGTYGELVARSRSFEALAVMKPWQPTVTGAAAPERLDGQRVSAAYFRVLGVTPSLGRDFQASDDVVRGPTVAIISDALWRRRFSGDSALVGQLVTLDGNSYTVVGVMPASFENVLAPSAEIWAPLQYDAALPVDGREWGHHLRMVGRIRGGIRIDRVKQEVDAIARAPLAEFPRVRWASLANGLSVSPLQEDVTRAVRPALLAVLGAVVLVLTISCVNVTNLLLGRGARRRGEFAMCAALGAGRGRLIRQLLTETLLLAGIAGLLGMGIATAAIRAFVALSPPGLPRADAIAMSSAVFAFGFGLTTVIGMAIGLVPALHATRRDLRAGLQQSATRTAADGHQATRRTLVVVEVALAAVLLVAAGLLVRSVQRLFAVAPGFDPSHLLTMQVQVSGHRFDEPAAVHRFFEDALDAVRRVPGVASAAFTSQLPLTGDFEKYGVQLESSQSDDPSGDQSALRYAISPEYLDVMRIPLRRGRLLESRDMTAKPVAVLISESLARRRFAGRDPVGKRLHVGSTDIPWYTVVGVVGDVKHASLAATQSDAVYVPSAQWYFADRARSLVVRAHADAARLAPSVKNAIWAVDKDQPIVRVATMDDLLARSAAERRFAMILFEAFAVVSLVLAAIGIYGILSGSVSERTREIGIRSALGASRADVLGLVIRQGMVLTALGVAAGLACAVAATRGFITLLFEVSPLDPATYTGVVVVLLAASGLACWVPAWRAARVDPSMTLRAE